MSENDMREWYIGAVLAELPAAMPGRDQIATELRAHIDERLSSRMPLAEVLDRLGDPRRLAESYIGAIELVPSPFGRRLLAKVIDLTVFVALVTALALLGRRFPGMAPYLIGALVLVVLFCTLYFVIAEYAWGTTIGKRLLGLYVVRESGTRIGLGQSFVRQFPLFFSFLFIDAAFIPFTERRQRAFEIVSKTRVVYAGGDSRPELSDAAPAVGLGIAL